MIDFIRRFLLILVIIILILAFVRGSADSYLDEWVGEYEYGDWVSAVVPGGINPTEEYNILIYKENGRYYADIIADGWMLGIRAKALVEGNENSIELIFLEYPEESMKFFKKDDIILSFTKKGQSIITKWISISPFGGYEGVEGIYFVKIK